MAKAMLEGVHIQSMQAADRLLAFEAIIIMLKVRWMHLTYPYCRLPQASCRTAAAAIVSILPRLERMRTGRMMVLAACHRSTPRGL